MKWYGSIVSVGVLAAVLSGCSQASVEVNPCGEPISSGTTFMTLKGSSTMTLQRNGALGYVEYSISEPVEAGQKQLFIAPGEFPDGVTGEYKLPTEQLFRVELLADAEAVPGSYCSSFQYEVQDTQGVIQGSGTQFFGIKVE